ncbi:MAG: hypothetical protein HY815_27285, partial [Candidatus Riflebacteria bacterium]|nr:hypothetical protein [Candidatus Riflebacteria bacterium]
LPHDLGGELLHVGLAMMYILWISFPIMGYKINEFFDVTRFLHYPVPTIHIFTGMLVASFLDLSSFILYPFLMTALFGTAPSVLLAPVSFLVLLLFTLHTFAVGQLVLFGLVHLLNLRRISELLLIVFPLILFVTVCGMELSYVFSVPGNRPLGDIPPSTVLSFLPSGVTANALLAINQGDLWWALYHMAVLAALTVLTLIVASHITDKILRHASPLEACSDLVARAVGRVAGLGSRVLTLLLGGTRPRVENGNGGMVRLVERLGINPQIWALAVKELNITLREPQVRMGLGFYLAGVWVLVWAGLSGKSGDETYAVLPMMALSSVFILGAVLLNSLALEREGLRFLLAAPVTAPVLLIGNNLAHWMLVTVLSTVCLTALAWAFRVSAQLLVGHLYLTQAMLIMLLGLGNLSSVLVPYRLPAKGLHPRQDVSTGHHFLVFFLGAVFSSLSMALAALSLAVVFFPFVGFRQQLIPLNLPISMSSVVAIWAACTALAAWVFSLRREHLLREVVD